MEQVGHFCISQPSDQTGLSLRYDKTLNRKTGRPTWLPGSREARLPGMLMLGRLRKLAWGVATGGGGLAGASCFARDCAVLISALAAAL